MVSYAFDGSNRNFEVFALVDFLATLSQHLPDQGVQMVRCYGLYSNPQRGCTQNRRGIGYHPRYPFDKFEDLVVHGKNVEVRK